MTDKSEWISSGFVPIAYISATWNPQEDITAYEVAKLLPFFHGRHMTEDDWAALGEATRHLKRY